MLGTDHFPLLAVAPWLLDDLGVTGGPKRDRAERHLFLTSVLSLGLEHVLESLFDEGSFYGREHVELALLLSQRATHELSRVVAPATPLWTDQAVWSLDRLEARVRERERGHAVPGDADDLLGSPRWAAPAKMVAAAAAHVAGRPAIVPVLDAMFDDLAAAFAIRADLATIHADLLRGRLTYPIAVIAGAAEMDRVAPEDTTRILGVMALTDALQTVVHEAIDRIRRCRRAAKDAGLRTIAAYARDVDAVFAALGHAITDRSPSSRGSLAAAPLFHFAERPLAKALEMAEGHLLTDLTFRASWELHREGMFGAPEVASRFPAGLILEILCGHGHDLGDAVDEFIALAAKERFRYYAHPASATDTDTLGVVLRLARYARKLRRHGRKLDAAIACVERHVAAQGSVPVWLGGCDGATADAPPQLLLGEGCATVAAHFLIGLSDLEFERHRTTIAAASRAVLERVRQVGLGANVNYPPLFAIGTFFRLAACLERRPIDPELRAELTDLRLRLVGELEAAATLANPTPQDAALLIRACDGAGRPDLLRPRWIEVLLKRQGFDGSWLPEPFAAGPNRGRSVTSYATGLLTTALCYDALRRWARSSDGTLDRKA